MMPRPTPTVDSGDFWTRDLGGVVYHVVGGRVAGHLLTGRLAPFPVDAARRPGDPWPAIGR